jgi:hypothetical protein
LIYGLIVILFLIMRIPIVRRTLASLPSRILLLFKKRTVPSEA